MKIGLINGSPKVSESASKCLLDEMSNFLKENNSLINYNLNFSDLQRDKVESISSCDVLVIAFPLYVDSIPSHFLNCLAILNEYFLKNPRDITVYALVNSGFHEGIQNKIAIDILKNWCKKSNLKWGQGIGIGAGGMIIPTKKVPLKSILKKDIYSSIRDMVNHILELKSSDDMYISHNIPRFLYKFLAEISWKQTARKNNLKL